MAAEPWQRSEIPGPTKAVVITKPEMVPALLKRMKNPIFVVSHKVTEDDLNGKKPIDYVISIAKSTKIPVVTTAHTVASFLERGFKPAAWMTAMDIGNRLADHEWSIPGRKPPHDLALIIGLPYYMGWLIESGLKSYAFKHLKTISLDRFYQPHCNWSFPNLSIGEWKDNLELIVKGVEKK